MPFLERIVSLRSVPRRIDGRLFAVQYGIPVFFYKGLRKGMEIRPRGYAILLPFRYAVAGTWYSAL